MNISEINRRETNWIKNFPEVYKNINFSKYIKYSKNHLDFGCGFGVFTYLLAKKHPKTVFYGTDIDPKMIALAKKKYHLKNLIFDSKKKIFYNSISCIYMLHHIKVPELILKELVDKLDTKGKIVILEFKKTEKKRFKEIYIKNDPPMSFEEYYKIHNRWTKEQFEKICKEAGLKTILLKEYGKFWFIYIGEKQL
jgi:ubiquinone/menaquinone biosynthesis C-methylase UbiE